MTNRPTAPLLALLIPLALYGGALISQYGFGLFPCEMCYWQRWPHQAAIILAALALMLRSNTSAMRALTILAAIAILVSGGIGVFHAGVEYGFWPGPACSTAATGPVSIDDLMAGPVIACDKPQFTLGGISLAGFNALFSFAGGIAISWFLFRRQDQAQ
ncbi:MAG: disulfide bond formation protein B [Sphingopyxis sp.]|nr:disulfide bond formation protein B [Sphingopyxis sp.]